MRVGLVVLLLALMASAASAEMVTKESGAFEVRTVAIVPGTPVEVYDQLTGDISGWWDHNVSGNPHSFTIDARPGGHFLEVFEDGSTDGVVHGTVIFAKRGERLTFRGPLGFNGHALDLVVTYRLEAVGDDRTELAVTCVGAGEMEDGWPEAVDRVWNHFIQERFVPWMEERGSSSP